MRRGKYEKQRTPIVNFAMTLAVVLFWLVVVTTYMSTGLFARYSTADSGSDGARVMTFGDLVVIENDVPNSFGEKYIFIPGVDMEKQISVYFAGSEADTFVFLCAQTTGWTRSNEGKYTLTQDGKEIMAWEEETHWKYLTSDGDKHVYYAVLESNTPMGTKTVESGKTVYQGLTFVKDGKITVSEEGLQEDYTALKNLKKDIKIDVTAYVVQANGFYADNERNSAMAAWNAISN